MAQSGKNQEGGIYCFPLAMSQPRPKLLSDWVNNPVTEIIKFWQQMEYSITKKISYDKVYLGSGSRSQSSSYKRNGNPKRSTNRPTAEKLLRAFCNITLSKHRDGLQEILGLNMLQKQILSLMKVPENIYTNLANDSG